MIKSNPAPKHANSRALFFFSLQRHRWRANPVAYTGLAWIHSMSAIMITLWTFKLAPTAAFCSSPTDPCSCNGGGFEIYKRVCDAFKNVRAANASTSSLTANSSTAGFQTAKQDLQTAKEEYKGIFDALTGDIVVSIIVSVITIALVVVIFYLARTLIAYTNEKNVAAIAKRRASELQESNIKLQQQRES